MRSLDVLYLRQWSVADDDSARARRRTGSPAPSPVAAALAGLVGTALAPTPAVMVAPARHRRPAGTDAESSPA